MNTYIQDVIDKNRIRVGEQKKLDSLIGKYENTEPQDQELLKEHI